MSENLTGCRGNIGLWLTGAAGGIADSTRETVSRGFVHKTGPSVVYVVH